MSTLTTGDIAEQIRPTLNDNWRIDVDERISYQIPGKPSLRRSRTVRSFGVYLSTFEPVYMHVALYADTLPALKKKIDGGELWAKIAEEFNRQAVKLSPEQMEKLGIKRPGIGQCQLALTHQD